MSFTYQPHTFKWSQCFLGTQWNILINFKTIYVPKDRLYLKILSLQFYGNSIGAVSQLGSTIVVMKTSSIFSTSLLEPASFHKTTFKPGFFKFSKKNSCIIWLGNMKGLNVIGSLCQKLTMKNPTLSHTYIGFLQLSSHFSHSHLKITIGVCTRP